MEAVEFFGVGAQILEKNADYLLVLEDLYVEAAQHILQLFYLDFHIADNLLILRRLKELLLYKDLAKPWTFAVQLSGKKGALNMRITVGDL